MVTHNRESGRPEQPPPRAEARSARTLLAAFCLGAWFAFLLPSCESSDGDSGDARGTVGEPAEDALRFSEIADQCEEVGVGYGESGTTDLHVEEVVTGLTVPWGLAFINESDFLLTERPGRVRLVRGGELVDEPVLNMENVAATSEGGLLGLALHPQFQRNRFFYLYATARTGAGVFNRVERFRLSDDGRSAALDRLILDRVPAGVFHDGGRIRFGPDGMLYVATGDARQPDLAQEPGSPAGKILRLTPDGGIPDDNPVPGSAVFISGVRNVQGFDWLNTDTLVVSDHGPSGELGRGGHDEISFAQAGANLGWPGTWQCQEFEGVTRPFLVWAQAAPPGGLLFYTGALVPEWTGSVLVTTLGSRHLQRIVLDTANGVLSMARHEVYLRGDHGRLREIVQAPDGSIYVTTSNCDSRGFCGPGQDKVLRLTNE